MTSAIRLFIAPRAATIEVKDIGAALLFVDCPFERLDLAREHAALC